MVFRRRGSTPVRFSYKYIFNKKILPKLKSGKWFSSIWKTNKFGECFARGPERGEKTLQIYAPCILLVWTIIIRQFARPHYIPKEWNWPISCLNDSKTQERGSGYRGLKSKKFPGGGAYPRTPPTSASEIGQYLS